MSSRALITGWVLSAAITGALLAVAFEFAPRVIGPPTVQSISLIARMLDVLAGEGSYGAALAALNILALFVGVASVAVLAVVVGVPQALLLGREAAPVQQWVAATAIGLVLGGLLGVGGAMLGSVLCQLALRSAAPAMSLFSRGVEDFCGAIALGGTAGLVLGGAQRAVLRSHVRSGPGWVLASALGGICAAVAAIAILGAAELTWVFPPVVGAAAGGAFGLVTGLGVKILIRPDRALRAASRE